LAVPECCTALNDYGIPERVKFLFILVSQFFFCFLDLKQITFEVFFLKEFPFCVWICCGGNINSQHTSSLCGCLPLFVNIDVNVKELLSQRRFLLHLKAQQWTG
jgi:hypothetical protein